MAKEAFEVEARRLVAVRHGTYPNDTWSVQDQFLAVLEVTLDFTAAEVIERIKREHFPHVPRCEICLAGWPAPRQWAGAEGGVV